MQVLFEAAKAMLNRALPSWTVWLGVAWAVLSGLPELINTVVGWFGPVTPDLTAKVVAISLLIARARSIVQPVIEGLLGKSSDT